MSLTFHKAAGRAALCLFVLAGAPAAAQRSAQTPTPAAPPAPLPRAFAGYAQPTIPQSACRVVGPAETRCEIPAMTAGRYLIEATGTATAQAAGARQQLEIVVGDQLCGVGRDLAAWSSGSRSFTFDCLTTVLTDKPLEIRALYEPVNAAKDPKGPQLVVRPLAGTACSPPCPLPRHTDPAALEITTMRQIEHFIDGRSSHWVGQRAGDVFNPNTGEVQARVAFGEAEVLDAAVKAAAKAQEGWAATNPQRRARVMFEFKRLVEANMDELAELLSSEHGKVVADSRGDVQRGLEVIEFACGIPHALKGEYTEGAGPGIDVYSMRQPLGVVAGITPFNFPAMIPMWMFGVAIAVGNSFILKPSEKDPSVPVRLAELMMEAGAPAGVLNVVHGDKAVVDAILEHPLIRAVSFVGSSDIAHYVYSKGAEHGKRVQAMGGAKNHGIVLPDADLDHAVKDLIGAAYGSAGERCMALPVVVPVGEKTAEALRERVLAEIDTLKVGVSTDPGAQYGPLVTAAHKKRVEDYIQLGADEGAELVLDGRGFSLQGYDKGFFVGPTLFDHVKPQMKTYKEEIFGPVLQIVRAGSFEEAVTLPSEHAYGNGVAIFTRNGRAARDFAAKVNVGMVGINVPIPVPVAYHTFGGWKRSAFGDANQHGMDGVRFFTKVKTVTARWPEGMTEDSAFVIPTMK